MRNRTVIADSPNPHCGVNQPYARVLSVFISASGRFCIVNPGGCIVYFPANGRDIQDIHDPDFPEQYQRLLERLDYQTMPGTKHQASVTLATAVFDLL